MAKKSNSSPMDPGEIGMIRNILMGRHIKEFEEHIQSLSEKYGALAESFNTKIDALEKDHQEKITSMEKDFSDRLNQLEKQFAEKIRLLDSAMENARKADKALLGKLLTETGNQLMNE